MKFNYQSNSLKSGIYKITNTHSNRVYIGQAKEFKRRWKQHTSSLRSNKHQNKFLQNDFNKCKAELGHDDFLVFEVIELMGGSTKEERNIREEWWISQYHSSQGTCYNIKQKVEDKERSCYSLTPEETSQKLSAIQKDLWSDQNFREESLKKLHEGKLKALEDQEFREQLGSKISATKSLPEATARTAEELKQRWSNPEYKAKVSEKISQARQTEESKQKQQKSMEERKADAEGWAEYQKKASAHAKSLWEKGLIKPKEYKIVDPEGNIITIQNFKEFCIQHGLSQNALRHVLYGSQKSHKGYTLPVE